MATEGFRVFRDPLGPPAPKDFKVFVVFKEIKASKEFLDPKAQPTVRLGLRVLRDTDFKVLKEMEFKVHKVLLGLRVRLEVKV
jgi:hypothetical protein